MANRAIGACDRISSMREVSSRSGATYSRWQSGVRYSGNESEQQIKAELAEMYRYLSDLCPALEAERLATVAAYIERLERKVAKLGVEIQAESVI